MMPSFSTLFTKTIGKSLKAERFQDVQETILNFGGASGSVGQHFTKKKAFLQDNHFHLQPRSLYGLFA